jgi:AcrR family transcriptional regulator
VCSVAPVWAANPVPIWVSSCATTGAGARGGQQQRAARGQHEAAVDVSVADRAAQRGIVGIAGDGEAARGMASADPKVRRRGRRQGEPVSGEAVLAAAKRRFADQGYEKTTLRAIAEDAHPSMVLCLFGSKAELFREALRLIIDPAVLVAAITADDGLERGTRMARAYLQVWEEPEAGSSMAAMLQSATSNSDAMEAFRDFTRGYVLTAVSGALGGGRDTQLRAMLAAALRGAGAATADLTLDEVVTLIAPSLQ